MKPHDIFEANDLFENGNMTQVQTTLVALAGLVCPRLWAPPRSQRVEGDLRPRCPPGAQTRPGGAVPSITVSSGGRLLTLRPRTRQDTFQRHRV